MQNKAVPHKKLGFDHAVHTVSADFGPMSHERLTTYRHDGAQGLLTCRDRCCSGKAPRKAITRKSQACLVCADCATMTRHEPLAAPAAGLSTTSRRCFTTLVSQLAITTFAPAPHLGSFPGPPYFPIMLPVLRGPPPPSPPEGRCADEQTCRNKSNQKLQTRPTCNHCNIPRQSC